ncbi:MAG: hypothetical protein ABIE43_01440 [Patescibacteria group bacterium]
MTEKYIYLNTYNEVEINSVYLRLKNNEIDFKKELSQNLSAYGYIGYHEIKIYVPELKLSQAKKILGIDKKIEQNEYFQEKPLVKLNKPLHFVWNLATRGFLILIATAIIVGYIIQYIKNNF